VTDRAIFNKRYTGFTPANTQVWLANGAGVTTTSSTSEEFLAGTDLIQGEVVYVSGLYVLPASAASGVSPNLHQPIGITSEAAPTNSGVTVILDDIAVVSAANLVGETSLTVGEPYYLSKYSGKLTRYSTASGVVTAPSGYAALVNLGTALSTSELHVEIQPSIVLYDQGSSSIITPPSTQNFTAGVNLIKGQVVYVSGIYALPASAASGLPSENYSVVGLTADAASASATVQVILDDVATVSDVNITAASTLVPGQYYYLSKSEGELTPFTSASGTVAASNGYAALVNLGLAITPTALHVQLQPPLELYS
jgi:hypothetical protein